jgi:hypothetical protein
VRETWQAGADEVDGERERETWQAGADEVDGGGGDVGVQGRVEGEGLRLPGGRPRRPSQISESDIRVRYPSQISELNIRVRYPSQISESDIRVKYPSQGTQDAAQRHA